MSNAYLQDILLQGYDLNVISQGYSTLTFNVSSFLSCVCDVLISPVQSTLGEYFPQWMDLYYETDPVTGSLLRRFLKPFQQELLVTYFYNNQVEEQRLFNHLISEIRKGWVCGTNIPNNTIKEVVVYCPNHRILPKKAISIHDFSLAFSPVYISQDQNIYFRNLHISCIKQFIYGDIDLQDDLIREEDIYYEYNNSWYRIEANDSSINYSTNIVSIPVTGIITLTYPSLSLMSALASGYVSVSSGPYIPLSSLDYWNSIDELGLVANTQRFENETNYNYLNRIKALYSFSGIPTEEGLSKSIGIKLDLFDIAYWDGYSYITWAASDNITNAWVQNYNKTLFSKGEILKKSNNFITSSKPDWNDYYIIFNGTSVVNLPTSGGRIFSNFTDNSSLTAEYSYNTYLLSTENNKVVQLSPTNNTEQDTYRMCWVKDIKVNTLNKKEYREDNLLTPDGNRTILLTEISEAIRNKVPITLNYAKWDKVHWFSENEMSPKLDYVPLAFDEE